MRKFYNSVNEKGFTCSVQYICMYCNVYESIILVHKGNLNNQTTDHNVAEETELYSLI